VLALLVDPQGLAVGPDCLVPLLEFAVGDALVYPRFLCDPVVLGEVSGPIEGLGGLLVAIDLHVVQADVEQFARVDVVLIDVVLV